MCNLNMLYVNRLLIDPAWLSSLPSYLWRHTNHPAWLPSLPSYLWRHTNHPAWLPSLPSYLWRHTNQQTIDLLYYSTASDCYLFAGWMSWYWSQQISVTLMFCYCDKGSQCIRQWRWCSATVIIYRFSIDTTVMLMLCYCDKGYRCIRQWREVPLFRTNRFKNSYDYGIEVNCRSVVKLVNALGYNCYFWTHSHSHN